jgi:hypothetical protein
LPISGIWQSTSTDGVTWTPPSAITTSQNAVSPVVAMNQDGLAAVAWSERDPSSYDLTINVSVRANGVWGAPHAMQTGHESYDRQQAVAVAAGNVTLTWRKRVGARFDLWGNRLPAGGGWGTPVLLETNDSTGAMGVVAPQLSVGTGGGAAVVWIYYGDFNIWANVFR